MGCQDKAIISGYGVEFGSRAGVQNLSSQVGHMLVGSQLASAIQPYRTLFGNEAPATGTRLRITGVSRCKGDLGPS